MPTQPLFPPRDIGGKINFDQLSPGALLNAAEWYYNAPLAAVASDLLPPGKQLQGERTALRLKRYIEYRGLSFTYPEGSAMRQKYLIKAENMFRQLPAYVQWRDISLSVTSMKQRNSKRVLKRKGKRYLVSAWLNEEEFEMFCRLMQKHNAKSKMQLLKYLIKASVAEN